MTIVLDEEMGVDARLEGHRIAVYHIVQYRDSGYSVDEISDEFDIDVELVEAALEYASNNTDDVSEPCGS